MEGFKKECRKVTVAAVQMTSLDGKIQENLRKAETMVQMAAKAGANLVVFPEFMPQGYRLTPELWDAAETMNGDTIQWLQRVSQQLGIYVGTSFLERDGKDYFNTFALSAPDGKIAGCIRKRNPSIWEAYFFKGFKGKHHIDTEIGRIGVAICFDNHTYEVCKLISESNIDIMLMPHSYCVPNSTNKLVTEADIDRLKGLPTSVAKLYNTLLGIPVVMVNKSGPWDSPVPTNIIPKMDKYAFSGRSCIIDADGAMIRELDDREGIAISDVLLNDSLKKKSRIPKYSRYIYPGPAGREITRAMELMGKVSYYIRRV